MNNQQKQKIKELRAEGLSYSKISAALGISENTIKSFCKRNSLGGRGNVQSTEPERNPGGCKNCGKELVQTFKHKTRKFCCHECYIKFRFKGGNGNADETAV